MSQAAAELDSRGHPEDQIPGRALYRKIEVDPKQEAIRDMATVICLVTGLGLLKLTPIQPEDHDYEPVKIQGNVLMRQSKPADALGWFDDFDRILAILTNPDNQPRLEVWENAMEAARHAAFQRRQEKGSV